MTTYKLTKICATSSIVVVLCQAKTIANSTAIMADHSADREIHFQVCLRQVRHEHAYSRSSRSHARRCYDCPCIADSHSDNGRLPGRVLSSRIRVLRGTSIQIAITPWSHEAMMPWSHIVIKPSSHVAMDPNTQKAITTWCPVAIMPKSFQAKQTSRHDAIMPNSHETMKETSLKSIKPNSKKAMKARSHVAK